MLSSSKVLAIGRRNIELQKAQAVSISACKRAGISKSLVKRAKDIDIKTVALATYGRSTISLCELQDLYNGVSLPEKADKRTRIGKTITQFKEAVKRSTLRKAYLTVRYLMTAFRRGGKLMLNNLSRIFSLLEGKVSLSEVYTELQSYMVYLIKQGAAARETIAQTFRAELEIAEVHFYRFKLASLS